MLFSFTLQNFDHPLPGVVPLVRNDGARLDSGEQFVGAGKIVFLPRREMECRRVAQGVHRRVDFRAQSASAAPERFRFGSPPFAPQPCWCARTTVASIMAYSLSASRVRMSKTRF